MKYRTDRKEHIRLGGMLRSIHISCGKPENPVVLFLHLGPDLPNRHGMAKNHMDLLDDFTTLAWDLRETGGFCFGCDSKTLTLEQLLSDYMGLLRCLCKTRNRKKSVLQ